MANFGSVSLELFIEHKPWNWEECCCCHSVVNSHFSTQTPLNHYQRHFHLSSNEKFQNWDVTFIAGKISLIGVMICFMTPYVYTQPATRTLDSSPLFRCRFLRSNGESRRHWRFRFHLNMGDSLRGGQGRKKALLESGARVFRYSGSVYSSSYYSEYLQLGVKLWTSKLSVCLLTTIFCV